VAKVTLSMLGSRSAYPVPDPNLSPHGQVWLVVPLTPGLPCALDIIIPAHSRPDLVVLGSLSLVLLPNGTPVPMVFLIGPPSASHLALRQGLNPDGSPRPNGQFAMLRRPKEFDPIIEVPPAPAPTPPVAEPFPAPPPPAVVTPPPAAVQASVAAAVAAEDVAKVVADFDKKAAREAKKAAAKANGANGAHKDEAAIVTTADVVTPES